MLSHKIVTTRKKHKCWGCAKEYPKGSRLGVINSVDQGQFHVGYWCEICREYWDKYMSGGDEIYVGELKDQDPEAWHRIKQALESEIVIDSSKVDLAPKKDHKTSCPKQISEEYQCNCKYGIK